MKVIKEASSSNPMDPETAMYWDYILEKKGAEWLSAALIAFVWHKLPVKGFIKDLFLQVNKDQEAGDRMHGKDPDEIVIGDVVL